MDGWMDGWLGLRPGKGVCVLKDGCVLVVWLFCEGWING